MKSAVKSVLSGMLSGLCLGLLVILLLLLTGCATKDVTRTSGNTAQPSLPAWLNMKEGYAEACAASPTGCTPFTEDEIRQMLQIVHKRTLEMCGKVI